MDRETLAFYERTAAQVAARHRASTNKDAWRRQFQESFPAGGRVLDVGCGSGRDLALLLELGFEAYGLEPSSGMRSEAVGAFPKLEGRVFPQGLPLPEDANLGGPYHAVLCSAVLMHVPEAELFDSAFSLKRVLSENGKLWISLPAAMDGGRAADAWTIIRF